MSVELTDVLVAAITSVAAYSLAPVYTGMIDGLTPSADPLSAMMLELVVPFVFVGIIISVGVSARRRR